MNKIELKPFDDYETVKKQANEYIHRIKYGVSLFEQRFGHSVKPTVFMSGDILSIIARGSERALMYERRSPRSFSFTVCGYNVKTVPDENVLSIGIDLL